MHECYDDKETCAYALVNSALNALGYKRYGFKLKRLCDTRYEVHMIQEKITDCGYFGIYDTSKKTFID